MPRVRVRVRGLKIISAVTPPAIATPMPPRMYGRTDARRGRVMYGIAGSARRALLISFTVSFLVSMARRAASRVPGRGGDRSLKNAAFPADFSAPRDDANFPDRDRVQPERSEGC